MNWIVLLFVFIAGAATSIQAGVNGALGKKVGIVEASFISFLVGTIFMTIIFLFLRKGNISNIVDTPKWQFTGGLLGSFYIMVMVVAVPRIGIAASLVTLIIGQLTCSTIIDHFGIIHGNPIPINWNRIAGLGLMGIAVFLYYFKK